MASSPVDAHMICPICKSLFVKPVSLTCGHNFCQDCIVAVLDTQQNPGVYSCPNCKLEFLERPLLQDNETLSDEVKHFISLQEAAKVLCTYCVDSPEAAVKTCLQCETSMCVKHLTAHDKAVAHVLVEPTSSVNDKKCSIHEKPLEYYCCEDADCLCSFCCLFGMHKGHQVELLQEASEKKKEKLRQLLEDLPSQRGMIEERIFILQDQKRRVERKAEDEKERVTDFYENCRRQLEVQEKRSLNEISRHKEQISWSLSNQIDQLETQKDEMSGKAAHIEKLCNMTNPINVLQDPESGDEDVEEPSTLSDWDDVLTSLVLHESINDLMTNMISRTSFPIREDLLLHENSAHTLVAISCCLKKASWSGIRENRPEIPERFTEYTQVMSTEGFSHGRHYWEVEVDNYGGWKVGISYPSIERSGDQSSLGDNKKSWCFRMCDLQYSAVHDSQEQEIQPQPNFRKMGIFLDYEAGRLSFYQLGDPIIHLHTFTATFTEPLHAAFYVDNGAWVKIRQ
ncbi:tripartite motif-containing protein 14-like [Hyperolius riggenbachi]|uniref:tripartite motif-containing protein 14-like n=1 Tax=Hyperolius riggenbachi TaxID=752182 RepID=UPI0035A33009